MIAFRSNQSISFYTKMLRNLNKFEKLKTTKQQQQQNRKKKINVYDADSELCNKLIEKYYDKCFILSKKEN